MQCPDDDDCHGGDTLLTVVVMTVVSTLVTGLATWALDELRAKYGSTPKSPDGKE